MKTVKRASLKELKDFANKVRVAGGGNPIDALIPAVPQDQHTCLIAKNLNFNCSVNVHHSKWTMWIQDRSIATRISEKLNLRLVSSTQTFKAANGKKVYDVRCSGVVLPDEIGQVAADFDDALERLNAIADLQKEKSLELRAYDVLRYELNIPKPSKEQVATEVAIIKIKTKAIARGVVKEMWPYMAASTKEAYKLATFVNPDGSIVI